MTRAAAPFTLPDRYRLESPVASGGMASVWAAHDTMLRRDVAVKVLAEHLGEDRAARARFQREARAAAGLSSHPNVVTIYDVGEHEGRSFIVMELREGGTIADVLARGRPDTGQAIAWLRDAAEAVDAAHEQGIVHRDIKPANLLLDGRGRVAVADFGIARAAEDPSITQTGIVLGTAAYISPEQAVGEPATPASDRYGLAVVAFELLTGSKPFGGDHFAAQARAHVEDEPPSASARADGLPPAVDAVLSRALAKDPRDRWPSAAEFVDALDEALRDRTAPTKAIAGGGAAGAGVAAGAAGAARGAGASDTAEHRTPPPPPPRRRAPEPPHPPPRKGTPTALLLAILGLLAVALVAILLATSGGGGEDPAPAPDRAEEATPEPTAESTPEPTPEPTAEATPEPTAEPEPQGGDPAQLNAQGFSLFEDGQYAEAVPYFERAVAACGDSTALDPCGYAYYNLGASLHRSGRSEEAIEFLEERLDRWPKDQRGTVKKELKAAEKAADGRGGDEEGDD